MRSLKDSGMLTPMKDMVKDTRSGVMVAYMKDTGSLIRQMEEEDLFTLTETFMMETGRTIKLTDMEVTLTQMVPNIKDIGKTINSMEKVTSNGLTVLSTQEATSLERKTVKEDSYGPINHRTMVISWTTISMELVSIVGPMEESTKEIG